MNRYPLWKYILLVVTLIAATLYTLPNFFGESPAVQVSSARVTVKVTDAMIQQATEIATTPGEKPIDPNYEAS